MCLGGGGITARKKNNIVIDLGNIKIDGQILDMGLDGNGIIYRALKNSKIEEDYEEVAIAAETKSGRDDCNWVYGYPDCLPFEDNSFDAVIAFLSLSYIKRKYIRNKTVREMHRVLKTGGKIYIWDMNTRLLGLCLKRKLTVILPQEESVDMEMKGQRRLGSFNMDSLIPSIERYFDIMEKNNQGAYFYIEASKKDGNS